MPAFLVSPVHFFELVGAVVEAHRHGSLRDLRDDVGFRGQSGLSEAGAIKPA